MSRDIQDLVPAFQAKVVQLIARLNDQGFIFRPIFTLRTPADQARLWRQSRSSAMIAAQVQNLRAHGAPWLAQVLESVGPQTPGPNVTNALPGLSWHQWGEACDCVWIVNGQPVWSGEGYAAYSREAIALGLFVISWERDHVQLRPQGSPASAGLSLAAIDTEMHRRFG